MLSSCNLVPLAAFVVVGALISLSSPVLAQPTVIDFDEVVGAPCAFVMTVPLSDEYAAEGVLFQGPIPGTGGSLLDQCSNPLAAGYSPPNFLLLNPNIGPVSQFGGPETLTFDPPIGTFSCLAGGTVAGTITISAFDASGALLDSMSVLGQTDVDLMSVAGAAITTVVLEFTGDFCLFDDLTFGSSVRYLRGDANHDGFVDISDTVEMLALLFIPGTVPTGDCEEQLDTNSDDTVDVADAVYLLAYLFILGSPPPEAPFPSCGVEPAMLGCVTALGCP